MKLSNLSIPIIAILYTTALRFLESGIQQWNVPGFFESSSLNLESIKQFQDGIFQAHENIRAAVGLPDPHIWKKGADDRLHPVEYTMAISPSSGGEGLVDAYIDAVTHLYDYLEQALEPTDIIEICNVEIERLSNGLSIGMARGGARPLEEFEKIGIQHQIDGYKQAIERAQGRLT